MDFANYLFTLSQFEDYQYPQQTCRVSRIRHETHAFEVYLMLSCLRLKSHVFVSTENTIFHSSFSDFYHVMLAQSAVMRLHVVRLSVRNDQVS